MEHQSKIKPKQEAFAKTASKMNRLVLTPVGYPLKAGDDSSPYLSTDDPSLFQHYARSQWIGLVVKKGNFLFDSLLFPDYAFRAITVEPKNSQITKNTQIFLYSEKKIDPANKVSQQHTTFAEIVGQQKAKEEWAISGQHISYVSGGVLSGVTSMGGNLIIFDDLIKGALEAFNANPDSGDYYILSMAMT